MPHISVLGANGVYARHLLPRLAAAGYQVRALMRRLEAGVVARACGAEIVTADIFDGQSLRAGLVGSSVCINLATSLPGPSGRGDYAVNDKVRREGVPQLIDACRSAVVPRLLQQSIAMVSANGEAITDGTTTRVPEGDDPTARALQATVAMEDAVQKSELDWLILRGGLFYGPGTGFDENWFERANANKLRVPGDGSDYVSLVHIADMAAATVAALQTWPSRQTIAVTDDTPSTWRDVFGYVAHLVGGEAPGIGGRPAFPSFRVSNSRARELLAWEPRYPDYRAGLVR